MHVRHLHRRNHHLLDQSISPEPGSYSVCNPFLVEPVGRELAIQHIASNDGSLALIFAARTHPKALIVY